MATQLGVYGVPIKPYGSFVGKATLSGITVQQAILAASTLSSPNTVANHLNNLNAGGGGTIIVHKGALSILFEPDTSDLSMTTSTEDLDFEITTQTVAWDTNTTTVLFEEQDAGANFEQSIQDI